MQDRRNKTKYSGCTRGERQRQGAPTVIQKRNTDLGGKIHQ